MEKSAVVIPSIPTPAYWFDLERDSPVVYAALTGACPALPETMRRLREALPLGAHCGEQMSADWYRLPKHYRSFCRPIDQAGPRDSYLEAPVVTFKGMEHLLADFPEYLQWMRRAQFRGGDLPLALTLPLNLRMPPGSMPLDEAVREQAVSIELQVKHLHAYGELAHTPVPLFIYRTDAHAESQYLDQLRRHLPAPALERVETRVRSGLAVGLSYYPRTPVRLDNISPPLPDPLGPYAQRALDDPDALIRRWMRLLARLLALGYMPYVPWNAKWGTCFDPGNACLDGGFTDLVTLTRFESLGDDRVFRASLSITLEAFGQTIISLCRQFAPPFAIRRESEQALTYVNAFMRPLFDEIFEEEARGLDVDSRLRPALRIRTFGELFAATEAISHRTSQYRVKTA